MKKLVFIGGGHGDESSSFIREILCHHSAISRVGGRDTFIIENIALLTPYISADSMFYLPRVASLKYIQFREQIVQHFGFNAEVRNAFDNLEATIAPDSIYIPRFGKFPLVQPTETIILREAFAKFIKNLMYAAIQNPYAKIGCERTPNNAQFLETIYNYLPDAKVVIVNRDPLFVAQSLRLVDWGPETAFETAQYTRQYYEHWFLVKSKVPDDWFFTICLEELLYDTDRNLSKLFSYLDLPIELDISEFAKNCFSKLSHAQDGNNKENEEMKEILFEVRYHLGYVK